MPDRNHVLRAYEEAIARGARHEAQALRVRYALAASDFDGSAFGSSKPLIVVPRLRGTAHEPAVAFLASFDAPERDVIFSLKRGVNRVGIGPPFGDFELPRPRPIESRQWLVVHRGGEVFVADDHSTNQSLVLTHGTARLAGVRDPRWEEGNYQYAVLKEGATRAIALDWAGDRVHCLGEGDVLCTVYSAFVFGFLSRSN